MDKEIRKGLEHIKKVTGKEEKQLIKKDIKRDRKCEKAEKKAKRK